MNNTFSKPAVLIAASFIALTMHLALAAQDEPGSGFIDHGIASPVSSNRGIVATVGSAGRDVVLVWMRDKRGGYALLLIDAETGQSEEYKMPFNPGGDSPYASILSKANKFYTHFNSHFVEFDPLKKEFTFFQKTARKMAMSMTEDDNGVIYSVTYPNSGVASFNPKSREFKDYGSVYKQNWPQYPRHIAADANGWIYFGTGSKASQIVAFNPETGEATPIFTEKNRVKGTGYVYRNVNGKVYGAATTLVKNNWYEFFGGNARRIGRHERRRIKPIITGDQGLFHGRFPDGKKLISCNIGDRIFVVRDPRTGKNRTLQFDYDSQGAQIMGLAVAPDNTICGGTAFPMRFFSYDPETDKWTNRKCYGQWNTLDRLGSRFFVGGYGRGFLLEWDPSRAWVPTVKGNAASNPLFLTNSSPTIHRPHALLAHPDGKTLVLAGTPGYGLTGGGLLIWNRKTRTKTVLEHTDIIPEHSTMSLVAMPNGKLLGGTTTSAGTGGETTAKDAELYIMDLATRQLEWHKVLFAGARQYTDLCVRSDGLVYGVADRKRFFVFDTERRQVIHEEKLDNRFGKTVPHQGPRVFVVGPDKKTVYMLFAKAIAQIDPTTFRVKLLSVSPVSINAGGDILNDRIYFASGSHLYSYGPLGDQAH